MSETADKPKPKRLSYIMLGLTFMLLAGVISIIVTSDVFVVDIADDLSAKDRAMVADAVKVLEKTCPLIAEYSGDYESADADLNIFYSNVMEFDKTHGWGRVVALELAIKNTPSAIPPEWKAQSYRLGFVMGGGHRPGIHLFPMQAARFCGLKRNEAFLDVPALAFIQ